MKKHIVTSVLYTVVTAVVLGIVYPLAVTGLAHVFFPKQAEGSLIYRADGTLVGSHLIGQAFDGPGYFWSRPSAAGRAMATMRGTRAGSNYAPTNCALATRVAATVQTLNPKGTNGPVPIDLATASASGLDPDISPAAAYYQVARVAAERHMSEDAVRAWLTAHMTPRAVRAAGRAAGECAGAESGSGQDGAGFFEVAQRCPSAWKLCGQAGRCTLKEGASGEAVHVPTEIQGGGPAERRAGFGDCACDREGGGV